MNYLIEKSIDGPIEYTNKKHYQNFLYHNANEHLGPDIWDVDSRLRKKQPFTELHGNEKGALHSYSIGSSNLADNLIDAHKKGVEPKQQVGYVHLPSLDAATHKFQLPKMTVFSGVKFDPRKLTQNSNGLFHSPANISSSIDPKVADEFSSTLGNSHILRIHVPEGHHGLYLGNDLNRSSMPAEHELLLPRGMFLKVNHNPTVFTHNSPAVTKHVWDAHIVPRGSDPREWKPPHIEHRDFKRG